MSKWPKLEWHLYYYRVIGYTAAGAGIGLIVDELIHGPFTLTPANHEFWGIFLVVGGLYLISKKPHEKN